MTTTTMVKHSCHSKQEQDETQTTMQPVSEEPIKFVHKLNPGEREYLSPNLIGVQNIAMTFLPLSMNFINIIDAFREIVNGVRYEIILNAVNTQDNNADIICRLVILEKPWLRTEWGDKVRELTHSNCTDEAVMPTPMPNVINDKYAKSTIFNGGSRNELSADEMKRLEDQIFSSALSYKRMPSVAFNTGTTSTTTTSTTTTTEKTIDNNDATQNVGDESKTPETDNTNNGQTIDDAAAVAQTTIQPLDDDTVVATTDPSQTQITSTPSSTTATGAAAGPVPELSVDEMKWLDDIFSVGALNFENNLNSMPVSSTGVDNVDDADDDTTHDNLQQQEQVNFFFLFVFCLFGFFC